MREGIAGLAAKGRYGDTTLVHMAPEEVAGLASLRQNRVSINPETGLPEMFDLSDILPTIVGLGLNFLVPGMPAWLTAIASGVTAAATTPKGGDPVTRGVLSGIASWGFGNMTSALGSAGATPTPAEIAAMSTPPPLPIGVGTAPAPELFDVLGPDLGAPAPPIPDSLVPTAAAQVTPPPPVDHLFNPLGKGGPQPWAKLPRPFQETLEVGGFGESDWKKMVQNAAVRDKNLPILDQQAAFREDLAPHIGAGRYVQAPPLEKVKDIGGGFKRVDWDRWSEPTKPGNIPVGKLAAPGLAVAAGLPLSLQGPPEYPEKPGSVDEGPYLPGPRRYLPPPVGYIPGLDPPHSYYAMGGTGGKTVRGGLPTLYAQEGVEGMTVEEGVEGSMEGSMNAEMMSEIPAGVAATTGIMAGAPPQMQDAVEDRLTERLIEEPQNPRERAIYDRAIMALQNELEPELAQRAIDEFLEVFGPEALHTLQGMVRGDRENGGTVETVSGETTVEEGEVQGPDVIAGEIVDPITGEKTGNLRVGENEYIEPAVSLVRRAQVAGLPPTPENGAMVRGEEERMLQQAVG